MDNEKLQKIDEVVNRTYVSYETAKKALEEANDDVLEAVILIENRHKTFNTGNAKQKGEQILEEIKKILKKGNATKITIKKNNETIINLPVTAGIVGAFVAPFLTAAGITAALLTQCSVEIQQADGKIIDLNEQVQEGMETVRSTMEDVKNSVSEGAEDLKNTFNNMGNNMEN